MPSSKEPLEEKHSGNHGAENSQRNAEDLWVVQTAGLRNYKTLFPLSMTKAQKFETTDCHMRRGEHALF